MSVTGKVVNFEIGPLGEIVVSADFFIDKEKFGDTDHKYFDPVDFKDRSKETVASLISEYLQERCAEIIYHNYTLHSDAPNVEVRKALATEVVDQLEEYRTEVLALTSTSRSLEVSIDSSGRDDPDQRWELFVDGQKTVKNISDEPIIERI